MGVSKFDNSQFFFKLRLIEQWLLQGRWKLGRWKVSKFGNRDNYLAPDPEDAENILELIQRRQWLESAQQVEDTVVVGSADFQPVSFMQEGATKSRAVCRIVREFSLPEFQSFIENIQEENIQPFNSVSKLIDIFSIPEQIVKDIFINIQDLVLKSTAISDLFSSLQLEIGEYLELSAINLDDLEVYGSLEALQRKVETDNDAIDSDVIADALFRFGYLEALKNIDASILAKLNPLPVGTGFLVGGNHVMTNHHVVPSVEIAEQCIAQFGYVQDAQGYAQKSLDYRLSSRDLFVSNPDLDYTLVQLNTGPFTKQAGYRLGWITLAEDKYGITPGWFSASTLSVLISDDQLKARLQRKINALLKTKKEELTKNLNDIDDESSQKIIIKALHNLKQDAQVFIKPKHKQTTAREVIVYHPYLLEEDLYQVFETLGESNIATRIMGDKVFIIQHPRGEDQQVVLSDNNVLPNGLYRNFLRYRADSDYGSSGSPVFNEKWQLVALHHAAIGETTLADVSADTATDQEDKPFKKSTTSSSTHNIYAQQGIRICRIVEDLKRQSSTSLRLQSFIENYVVTAEQFNYPPLPAALEFDGAYSYVSLDGEDVDTAFTKTRGSFRDNQAFSIEAWVNPYIDSAGGTIIGKWREDNQGEYLLSLTAKRTIVFSCLGAEPSQQIYSLETDQEMTFGQFNHVAAVFDGKTMQIYLNGKPAAPTPLVFLVDPKRFELIEPSSGNSRLQLLKALGQEELLELFKEILEEKLKEDPLLSLQILSGEEIFKAIEGIDLLTGKGMIEAIKLLTEEIIKLLKEEVIKLLERLVKEPMLIPRVLTSKPILQKFIIQSELQAEHVRYNQFPQVQPLRKNLSLKLRETQSFNHILHYLNNEASKKIFDALQTGIDLQADLSKEKNYKRVIFSFEIEEKDSLTSDATTFRLSGGQMFKTENGYRFSVEKVDKIGNKILVRFNGLTVEKQYKDSFIPVLIGAHVADPAQVRLPKQVITGFFKGSIAEVRIWNQAISTDQVRKNMNRRLNPAENLHLVGYWQFGRGVDNRIINLAKLTSSELPVPSYGKALNVQWINASLFPPLPLPFSLEFNGKDAYVDCGDVPELKEAITVEAWIKHSYGDGLIVRRGGNWNDSGYSLFWHRGKIRVELQDKDRATKLTIDTQETVPSDGTWHHVAFAWTEKLADKTIQEVEVYVDGRRQNVIAIEGESKSILSGGLYKSVGVFKGPIGEQKIPLTIGGIAPKHSENKQESIYFDGAIAEVRLWNRARTQNEIKANLYNRLDVKAEKDNGLIGYWRLDEEIAEDLTVQTNGATEQQLPPQKQPRIRVNNQISSSDYGIVYGNASWFPSPPTPNSLQAMVDDTDLPLLNLPESSATELSKSEVPATKSDATNTPTTELLDSPHWASDFIAGLKAKNIEFFKATSTEMLEATTTLQQLTDVYQQAFKSPLRVTPTANPITRFQAIGLITKGLGFADQDAASANIYTDRGQIPKGFRAYISTLAAATQLKLVVNYPQRSQLRPNDKLTQAELAALIYQGLVAKQQADPINSDYIVQADTLPAHFSDIAGHWAEPSLQAMGNHRFVSGFPDGTLKPDNQITRAEYAALLVKVFDPTPKRPPLDFQDLPQDPKHPDFWVREPIQKAYQGQLMGGVSDTRFDYQSPITRLQVIVSLVEAIPIPSDTRGDNTTEIRNVLNRYSDADSIPDWATDNVAIATQNHLIVTPPNIEKTQLHPNRQATRAEVIAMLHQALAHSHPS